MTRRAQGQHLSPLPEMEAEGLAEFLAERNDRVPGCFTFPRLAGFLFAIANGPEMIMPSAWLSVVLGGKPAFETSEEARVVLDQIMALFSAAVVRADTKTLHLPFGLELDEDALANFASACPAADWATGFINGHAWTREAWDEWLPEEWSEELDQLHFTLGFFHSRKAAEKTLEHPDNEGLTLLQVARDTCEILPSAAHEYGLFGRTIQRALLKMKTLDPGPARSDPVGRNQPCPCGSGQKYKRCCARN